MFLKSKKQKSAAGEVSGSEIQNQIGPAKKREIFSWAMFDFANSSYTTVVITAVFSAYFVDYIVPKDSTMKDSSWSIAIATSTILALVLSPFAGAVCDLSGRKKRYLTYSTILCAITTALLYFVGAGDVWQTILLITISNAAFMLSETFCGSFLPDLANKENMGLISGIGWGLGYFGGLASLAAVMVILGKTEGVESGEIVARHQLAMVATGAFFLCAALPTLLFVEKQKPTCRRIRKRIIRAACCRRTGSLQRNSKNCTRTQNSIPVSARLHGLHGRARCRGQVRWYLRQKRACL